MSIESKIQAVVLAAGCSVRFGDEEKTLALIDGIPMAIKTALSIKATIGNVIMIVNQKNSKLQQLATGYDIDYVVNNDSLNTGIGSSISLAVTSSEGAAGWVFCPADMPFIRSSTYLRVMDNLIQNGKNSIVVPRFQGRAGHPVGFGKVFQNELKEKAGDVGGRTIIKNNLSCVRYIEVEDSSVVVDIDTQSDFERLSN
jgi:molybdenum cofactor cytidylyltransferase